MESILGQKFADFEVIILDDASTDGSREVIASFCSDTRVRFLFNDVNSGSPFVQWNRGVELAKGEFVWIAESDDYADPILLSVLVDLLRGHPRVGIAYCQSLRIDADDKVYGTMEDDTTVFDAGARWQHEFVADGREECRLYLIWRNTIPNASAVVFRRDVFLKVGGAMSDLRLSGDWLMWVRMLLISDIVFTPEHLNYFRHHEASVRARITQEIFFDERWRVQHEIIRQLAIAPADLRSIAKQTVNEHLTRVRLGPHGFDVSKFLRGLRLFWPLYLRAPWASISVVMQRATRKYWPIASSRSKS